MSLERLFLNSTDNQLVVKYTTHKVVEAIRVQRILLTSIKDTFILTTENNTDISVTADMLPVTLKSALSDLDPVRDSKGNILWDYDVMIVKYGNGYISTCPTSEFMPFATPVEDK